MQPTIYAKLPPGVVPARDWLTPGKAYTVTSCVDGLNPAFFIFADDGKKHELFWTGGIAAREATWLYAFDNPVGLPGPFKPGPPPEL